MRKAALLGYGWPGNVRELKNAVERSVYRTDEADKPIERILFDPFASPYAPAPHRFAREEALEATADAGLGAGDPRRFSLRSRRVRAARAAPRARTRAVQADDGCQASRLELPPAPQLAAQARPREIGERRRRPRLSAALRAPRLDRVPTSDEAAPERLAAAPGPHVKIHACLGTQSFFPVDP